MSRRTSGRNNRKIMILAVLLGLGALAVQTVRAQLTSTPRFDPFNPKLTLFVGPVQTTSTTSAPTTSPTTVPTRTVFTGPLQMNTDTTSTTTSKQTVFTGPLQTTTTTGTGKTVTTDPGAGGGPTGRPPVRDPLRPPTRSPFRP